MLGCPFSFGENNATEIKSVPVPPNTFLSSDFLAGALESTSIEEEEDSMGQKI